MKGNVNSMWRTVTNVSCIQHHRVIFQTFLFLNGPGLQKCKYIFFSYVLFFFLQIDLFIVPQKAFAPTFSKQKPAE